MANGGEESGTCFIAFKHPVKGIDLPARFTFPFHYDPHPLALQAVAELQEYLLVQNDFEHNFGLDDTGTGLIIGKMFGVLVVQDEQGTIGYIAAFSGKLANENHHRMFVPPVFDMLFAGSYFLKEEENLNRINEALVMIEQDEDYAKLLQDAEVFQRKREELITSGKRLLKDNKQQRKEQRKEADQFMDETGRKELEERLVKESLKDKYTFSVLQESLEREKEASEQALLAYTCKITALKEERKQRSSSLQDWLFKQYKFLNQYREEQDLLDIFSKTIFQKPPAAAGDCAAPKLLQYAFKHQLKPLCMAEFWWGESPKSEVRKHGQFYPACTGKCEPILSHMLKDIPMDADPMKINPAEGRELPVVFEDEALLIVNKPHDFLSVPGIDIQDSVYTRIRDSRPELTGPLIVHRLDMATSGLLIIAKTKEAHKALQRQFLKRIVSKRYSALLNGTIEQKEGEVNLPLRGDLEDRPRQLVCFTHGKEAVSKYQVIKENKEQTLVHFWPHTGRTHQLRMHASHSMGLNAPIVGDDLYGEKAERLYLHAEYLKFIHPLSGQWIEFYVPSEFEQYL